MPATTETIAVIDFETTGLAPAAGARATEIAAVLVRGGQIVDHYASLMRSGAWVPPFIEQLTGISNAMLERAPPAGQVMREVAAFVGESPLVAHNASFDRSFWCAELQRTGRDAHHRFACTMLLARRLYPESANHRLGTLAALHRLPTSGRAHRALADAHITAQLLLQMQRDVMKRFALPQAPHTLLMSLQRARRDNLAACVARHALREGEAIA
jgi:DNA polymerase III subunit epsilon